MIDKNGKTVEEGARCRFYAETREAWLVGPDRWGTRGLGE